MMAASTVEISRSRAQLTEKESERKAGFDSGMVLVRHHVRFADSHSAAEYMIRQMMQEVHELQRKFNVKP